MTASKVRVLVVDDSAFFRRRIAAMLGNDPMIEVVGFAGDGQSAIVEARRLKPDVITMDVEMPVLDGISAVKRIVAENPIPILMFSSLTHEGAKATLDALEAGAVDFLPKQFDRTTGQEASTLLARRVLAIGTRGVTRRLGTLIKPQPSVRPVEPRVVAPVHRGSYKLVAIGASTGGPVAIQTLLSALPADFPVPIIIVVHMPASFTPAYAERLDSQCAISIKEAADHLLRPACAYLAPGGKQMILERRGEGAVIRIKESTSDQTYRPCVDVSLGSAARLMPRDVLAIILTGMGADGKQATRALKEGGSTVWSQSEESCVVYGMPQAVEKAGLSDRVLALADIGPSLIKAV